MHPTKLTRCFCSNLLTILTLAGVVSGVVLGLILRSTSTEKWTSREVMYLNFPGDLFLRLLKSIILPLIISSLVAAIGSLDLSLSKKIGGRAIAFYVITTVIAVTLGIILVTTIKPGYSTTNVIKEDTGNHMTRNITTADTMLDLLRNMFPPNIVQACIAQFQTNLVPPANNRNETDLLKWDVKEEYVSGMNILGLVVVSAILGVTLSILRDETKTVLKLFEELNRIMMKVTSWVIWLSPVGICFLISSKMMEIDDFSVIIGKLGLYCVTVAGGIMFHGFVILPIIFYVLTRLNPFRFIGNMSQAMATAFGTASSSASLPVTMQCLEEGNNVDPRISRFVLPIGATINMDGTALYEAVAAIFIAQVRGLTLTFGNLIAISITATAASIGAAGIPHAGLVTLVLVLDTVGLPAEDVSLIIGVDFLLDRFRTLVNVLGDSFGAAIVAHHSQHELFGLKSTDDTTDEEKSNMHLKHFSEQTEHR